MPKLLSIICVGAMLVSCGKKTSGKSGKSGGSGKSKKPDLSGAVAAVNKLVPASLKDKLAFTVVKCRKDRCLAVGPKGWDEGPWKGRFAPKKGAGLGFFTRFTVGTNCNGDCVNKDWPATADKVEFKQFMGPGYRVLKDEKKPKGRVAVVQKAGSVYIISAKYKKGGSRYFYCRATLAGEISAAAPAFEKACRTLAPLEWE